MEGNYSTLFAWFGLECVDLVELVAIFFFKSMLEVTFNASLPQEENISVSVNHLI
jgi:hypothetical protein